MKRKFSSFEEIDAQLELLRVQRQLSMNRLRLQLRESPVQIASSLWTQAVKPALANAAIGWLLRRLRGMRQKLRPELPPAA